MNLKAQSLALYKEDSKNTAKTIDDEKEVKRSKYTPLEDLTEKLNEIMLAKVSKRGIDEMLVMPRKAKRKDHDFCNLYNSKIFKAK